MKRRSKPARRATKALTRRSPRRSTPSLSSADNAALTPPLSTAQELFVAEYFAQGRNAAGAYRVLHPKASQRTSEQEGYCLRHTPAVAAAIREQSLAQLEKSRLKGEHYAGLLALIATADIRELYGPDGRLLPPRHWPDGVALAVNSVSEGGKVRLESKIVAIRTALEQLKEISGGALDLNQLIQLARAKGDQVRSAQTGGDA